MIVHPKNVQDNFINHPNVLVLHLPRVVALVAHPLLNVVFLVPVALQAPVVLKVPAVLKEIKEIAVPVVVMELAVKKDLAAPVVLVVLKEIKVIVVPKVVLDLVVKMVIVDPVDL